MEKAEPTKINILFSRYIFKSWDASLSLLTQTIALVIIYLFFEDKIEDAINLYWVERIKALQVINSLASISIFILILEGIYFGYQIRAKNFTLKPFEIFTFLFYIKYRFWDIIWCFYPYSWDLTLFDAIPAGIFISKLVSVIWFCVDLESSRSRVGVIDPDLPLSKYNPTDELKRTKFANDLVSVLKETRPSEQALVIGINGVWGSGKSSLAYLIKDALQKQKKVKPFHEVVFNPWLYSQDKSLAQSFLNVIKQSTKKNEYIVSSRINSYAKILLRGTESILLNTRFLKDFTSEHTLEDELKIVKSYIRDLKRTLLVILDDLDRLSKEELLEVFRLIRFVGDFPNTIYIVLYDKQFVKAAIEDALGDHNADIYIDKIVQVEYTIPESTIEHIRQLFLNHLSKSLKQGIPESQKLWNDERINLLIKVDLFSDAIKNIRDIKRFTNNFLLRYKSIYSNVNFSQFLLIELIRYRYPEFISLLYSQKDLFIKEVKSSGQFHQPDIPIVPSEFWKALKDNYNLTKVLKKIAEFEDEEHSISEPFYFANYFTLTIQEDLINDAEFKQAITQTSREGQTQFEHWQKTNPDMLIYKFRNHDSFSSINSFIGYMDHLILVSNYIRDEERSGLLPRILTDKYRKLKESNIDTRVLYEQVAGRIFGEEAKANDTIKNIFRNDTSFKVKGDNSTYPLLGWSARGQKDNKGFESVVTVHSDNKEGRYTMFGAPPDVLFEYDFPDAPDFLRNVYCEFKQPEYGYGSLHIKIQIKKEDRLEDVFISPQEQPGVLGRIFDDVYAIGVKICVKDDWKQYELNMTQAFLQTDFIIQGYKLVRVAGITIRGTIGLRIFELY